MDVSKLGGYSPLAVKGIRFNNSDIRAVSGTKPNKVMSDKEPINDNFSNRAEAASNVGVLYNFREARIEHRKATLEKAISEGDKELEMRQYWGEYSDIFSGGSPNGWGRIDMDTMYSQASDIYKQIEESSDSEETKATKRQALANALNSGTSMYKMRIVGEKMKADALETEAQGKTVDRSYRSKAKFDKLSEMSGAFDNITALFFNNLKKGKIEGVDYGAMMSDVVNKIMSYKHTSS